MSYEQKILEGLYNQYNKQITKDYFLRYKTAKRLNKFAPFKKGDKIKYAYKWVSAVIEFKNFGVVVSCEYHPEKGMGKWRICVKPTTKSFEEHKGHFSHSWLGVKHVRKFKP